MNLPDSVLRALDDVVSGQRVDPLPETGLEPGCQAVVGRINQLIGRLREAEVNARLLLEGETLPTLVSRVSDGRMLFANARARALFPETVAKDITSHAAHEIWADPSLRQVYLAQVCEAGRVDGFEADLLDREGRPYYALVSASRITFKGIDAILSSFQSITERRHLEQRLEEALDLNQKMLDALPLGVTAYRSDTGACVLANRAMSAIIGATREQILAQCFRTIPSWREFGLLEGAERCVTTGETTHVTTRMVTSFGRDIWVLATFTPFTTQGEPHLLLILKDVSERVEAERSLKKSHDVLLQVGSLARVGGWELDLVRNTLTWSPVVREIHEVGPDYQPEVATAISFYAPEALPVITAAVQRAVAEGVPFDHELPLITAKGRRIWVRAIGRPYDEDGKVIRIGGVFQDITDKRASETRMRQLALAVEQSPVSVLITDMEGRIEYVNSTTCRQTGYDREALQGQNPRVLKSGCQPDGLYTELWAAIAAGREWRGEFQNKRKDGELYWVESVISPLRDEGGAITHFVAVQEDVSERRRMEDATQALVTSLQQALDDVKLLQGLLPICAGCKKIRNETGYWDQLEHYFAEHSDLSFTHGLCPDCAREFFPKKSKG